MRTSFSMSFAAFCAALFSVTVQAADIEVADLIKSLGSNETETRTAAIDDLTALGADARDAVPALVEALNGSDTEIAWRAGRALGAIGIDAAPAVSALRQALGHDDAKVRAYAAFATGRIGQPALAAVDQLIENAFDTDPMVRRSTLRALQRLDPPIEKTMPLVIEILQRGDISTIMPALSSLAQEGERAVPRLRKALAHKEARYWACLVLADIGPAAAAAVPELQAALADDPNPDTRLQALVALGEIGESAQTAIPAILSVLEHEQFPNVQYAAVFALGKIGGSEDSRTALQKAMDSDDEFLRTISSWALARGNSDDAQLVGRAVEMVVAALNSENVDVRRAAARAVVEFDVDPAIVAPALVRALQDKDDTVVANAIDALAALGPKALVHIDDALANEDLRHYAVRLIGRLGPDASSAVPALVNAISQAGAGEEDQEFIREAQFALSAIGSNATDAIPALVKSLSSADEEISASACFALGKIGPAAIGAVPQLRRLLSGDSTLVQLASIRALLEIQPGQRQLAVIAAPRLIMALNSDREMVRAEAASALGDMGIIGRRAIPTLQKLLNDNSESVKEAAAEALKKLGG